MEKDQRFEMLLEHGLSCGVVDEELPTSGIPVPIRHGFSSIYLDTTPGIKTPGEINRGKFAWGVRICRHVHPNPSSQLLVLDTVPVRGSWFASRMRGVRWGMISFLSTIDVCETQSHASGSGRNEEKKDQRGN